MTTLAQYLKAKQRATYDAYGQRIAKPKPEPTHKTLVLTIEQWEIVMLAHERMKEMDGQDITRGQTVERCCADWLSGA